MFLKSFIFLHIAAALAYQLTITPDELKSTWDTISVEVESRQHEAQIAIRATTVRLSYTCGMAKKDFIGNISAAAQPYWNQISELEKNASSQGQDISTCVQLGNQQLYALNVSLANAAEAKIDSIEASGNDFISKSYIPGYVIDDIVIYGNKVENCSDDTCASELQTEILTFYKNATTVIDNCLNGVDTYFEKDLPEELSAVKLDADDYKKKFAVYLNDIEECIQQFIIIK